MPEEIRHLGEMPLFRAVAWWGFLRNKEFSRNDVSKAAPATRQVKKSTATDDRQLSHWLLSRPTGNNEAKLAAWKAACPLRE